MSARDVKIYERDVQIYDKINELCEQMGEQFPCIDFSWLDCDEIVLTKIFSTGKLKLKDGSGLMIFEAYIFDDKDKLELSRYCYKFYDSDEREIFRADNSAHHPDVSTSPHHIHDNRFGEGKPPKQFRNPGITEFFAHIRGERR